MNTPPYYELKSIEKDGLPKDGKEPAEYICIIKIDGYEYSKLVQFNPSDYYFDNVARFADKNVTHWLSPISLPEKTMSAE